MARKEPELLIENTQELDVEAQMERMTRREARRRRHLRNKIIAYIILVVMVMAFGVLVVGGFTLLRPYLEKDAAGQEAVTEIPEQTPEAGEEPEQIPEQTPEVTETPEEPPENAFDETIKAYLSAMTLEEKVAGLFVLTPEGLTGATGVTKAGDATKAALEQYPVGGMIYFAGNIKNADQIKEMIANTASYAKYPLFLAVDEEGGSVSRVAEKLKLDNVGTPASIGETANAVKAQEAARTVGTYLREYGFNLDLAPVADVRAVETAKIGTRAYGSDPALVSLMVSSAVQGLREAGVSSCLKHFPGEGDVTVDIHKDAAVSELTREGLMTAIQPFSAGIMAGADMVMVGHVALPAVTGDNTPASLSTVIITDTLRVELGYDGVVITDALNMAAVEKYYTSAEAAVKALQAGADLILMPVDFNEAYQGVLTAISEGELTEARIYESLLRIYRIKLRE